MNLTKQEEHLKTRLAKRLTRLRGERSQRELARQAGIFHTMIGKFESGERMPGPFMLMRLAKVFGCSVDELLGV